VQAAWLVDCFRALSRSDEHRYLLNDAAAGSRLPRALATTTGEERFAVSPVRPLADSTRGINSPSGEEDDDDDEDDGGFAAELESEMMGQQDVDKPS
jgi:hypothetical protein